MRGAYTPDECQATLTFENPSYSPLIIAQAPNWVKPTSLYTHGSSLSLVVAFEDPNGTKARALLGVKHLYAFGTCATLWKWKQCPTPSNNSPSHLEDPIIITAPLQLPPTFLPGQVPAATRPFTRQVAQKPKTSSSARVMHKTQTADTSFGGMVTEVESTHRQDTLAYHSICTDSLPPLCGHRDSLPPSLLVTLIYAIAGTLHSFHP